MENSPSGVSLLKVSASDADVGANGQISYSLHGPHAQHFRMDPRTGGSLVAAAPAATAAVEMCGSNGKMYQQKKQFENFCDAFYKIKKHWCETSRLTEKENV